MLSCPVLCLLSVRSMWTGSEYNMGAGEMYTCWKQITLGPKEDAKRASNSKIRIVLPFIRIFFFLNEKYVPVPPLTSVSKSYGPHCYKLVIQRLLPAFTASLFLRLRTVVGVGWWGAGIGRDGVLPTLACAHVSSELLPINSSIWESWILVNPPKHTERRGIGHLVEVIVEER